MPILANGFSTASAFYGVPLLLEKVHNYIAMIALNFDGTRFHRPASTALLLELFCELLQRLCLKRYTGYHCHAFALTASRCPTHSHNSICFWAICFWAIDFRHRFFPTTGTLRHRLSASRTHLAIVR